MILASAGLQAYSQNTGYLGKHVILKTDVINGKRMGFQNVDLEVVTGRNLSFTGSIRKLTFAALPEQHKKVAEIETSPDFDDFYDEFVTLFPEETKGQMGTVGVKYYFNKILPAPLGFYCAAEFGYGSAAVNLNALVTYKPHYGSWGEYAPDNHTEIINRKVKFSYVSLPSFGYQRVFFNRLVIDGKISYEFYTDDLPDDFVKRYLRDKFMTISAAADTYSSVLSTNLTSTYNGNRTHGLAIYGKVGFLLF
jgi:hypothetical protein